MKLLTPYSATTASDVQIYLEPQSFGLCITSPTREIEDRLDSLGLGAKETEPPKPESKKNRIESDSEYTNKDSSEEE